MNSSRQPHSEQYFARYAEPEAALAQAFSESYAAALVVPARAESPHLLEGFESALQHAPGRILLVLVVNATEDAPEATHAANQHLLERLRGDFPNRRAIVHAGVQRQGMLGRARNHDLLLLDCASVGARLPPRTGVGTVRKLGADLAVALWNQGQIRCPRIASTDADVTLPADYFSVLTRDVPETTRSSAWLWPFRHRPGAEASIDRATELYEISLRYYVLGLGFAGSSYAYQSIGSTICVDAPAYLSVRGFPRREAGEDFYLLDKLGKVAPLRRVPTSPLAIRARASDRVPFGTGRRSREIAEQHAAGSPFLLYGPRVFDALRAVLLGLNEFADSKRIAAIEGSLAAHVPELIEQALAILEGLGLTRALLSAAAAAPAGPVLRRRIHTWFDALRTLRFIHGLRDRGVPSLPWRDALRSADFSSVPLAGSAEPLAILETLAAAEAGLPEQIGPALA